MPTDYIFLKFTRLVGRRQKLRDFGVRIPVPKGMDVLPRSVSLKNPLPPPDPSVLSNRAQRKLQLETLAREGKPFPVETPIQALIEVIKSSGSKGMTRSAIWEHFQRLAAEKPSNSTQTDGAGSTTPFVPSFKSKSDLSRLLDVARTRHHVVARRSPDSKHRVFVYLQGDERKRFEAFKAEMAQKKLERQKPHLLKRKKKQAAAKAAREVREAAKAAKQAAVASL